MSHKSTRAGLTISVSAYELSRAAGIKVLRDVSPDEVTRRGGRDRARANRDGDGADDGPEPRQTKYSDKKKMAAIAAISAADKAKKHAWQKQPQERARSTSKSRSPSRREQLGESLRKRAQKARAKEEREIAEAMESAAHVEELALARQLHADRSLAPPEERPPFRPTSPSGVGVREPRAQFLSKEDFPLYHSTGLAHSENFAAVSAPSPSPFEKERREREAKGALKKKQVAMGWFEQSQKRKPTSTSNKSAFVNSTFARRPPYHHDNDHDDQTANSPVHQLPAPIPSLASPPVPAVAARQRRMSLDMTIPPPPLASFSAVALPVPAAAAGPRRPRPASARPAVALSLPRPAAPVKAYEDMAPHEKQRHDKAERDKNLREAIRAVRAELEEATRDCAEEECDMNAVSALWKTANDRYEMLSHRTKHIEAEALSIQETQRAEVLTYQERIVKIMHRNKEVTLDAIDASTKERADLKVDATVELKSELADLEQLEQRLALERTQHQARVTEINQARSSVIQRTTDEIQCEATLRTHALDKQYAAKEAALRSEHKAAVDGVGRHQDRLVTTLTTQHDAAIKSAQAQSEKILRSHAEQIDFLQNQLGQARIGFVEHEQKVIARQDDLAEKTTRLEHLKDEDRTTNFALDEAVATREELDHTNASVLLLEDRVGAWQRSLHELAGLYHRTDAQRRNLHDCYRKLIDNLHSKNAQLQQNVEAQALAYYEQLRLSEIAREEEEKKHPAAAASAMPPTEDEAAVHASPHPSPYRSAASATESSFEPASSSPRLSYSPDASAASASHPTTARSQQEMQYSNEWREQQSTGRESHGRSRSLSRSDSQVRSRSGSRSRSSSRCSRDYSRSCSRARYRSCSRTPSVHSRSRSRSRSYSRASSCSRSRSHSRARTPSPRTSARSTHGHDEQHQQQYHDERESSDYAGTDDSFDRLDDEAQQEHLSTSATDVGHTDAPTEEEVEYSFDE